MKLLANCTYISLVLNFLVSSLIKLLHLIDNSRFKTFFYIGKIDANLLGLTQTYNLTLHSINVGRESAI